jgi:translocation and assembly module TamB
VRPHSRAVRRPALAFDGVRRDFIVSQIDGREVAGYGRLSVRKLEGDPLSEFSIGEIEIRDASGVWLTAEALRVTWSPAALLSRTVDLQSVALKDVSILRRPVRAPRPDSDSKPWEVRLSDAQIKRLYLAQGVAGPESASAISARFLNERSGSIDAHLRIEPLDGAGDRIEATILRDRSAAFDLKVDGYAPAGGVFAHLLQLQDGASAIVSATAAGNLDDGRGEARLTVDGSDKVWLSGKIEDGAVDANVRLDAQALPIRADIATFLGPKVEADVTATFARKVVTFNVAARIAAGTFTCPASPSPIGLSSRNRRVSRPVSRRSPPCWEAPRAIALDGTLEARDTGYQYVGDASIELRPEAGLPFEVVSGPGHGQS